MGLHEVGQQMGVPEDNLLDLDCHYSGAVYPKLGIQPEQ